MQLKHTWFFYDPDSKAEDRREKGIRAGKVDPSSLFCISCYRTIADVSKAVRVDEYWDLSEQERKAEKQKDGPYFYEMCARLNPHGQHFIGPDCMRRLVKMDNED